jgi:hypothetical protein
MIFTPLLISLSITCFALYVRNVAREEMLRIAAAILSFLSFIVGLMLAPWFIQVLLLLAIIFFWHGPAVR